MNALQEKPAGAPPEPPRAATRPFTRVPNVICDEIKPAMRKHKVDRSVLDAIVRLLEGFHRSFVVVTIAELAARAGVSHSSVSAALARLEAEGLITRQRKILRDRSRFVWCLALTEKYRVVGGIGPAPRPPTKFHNPTVADPPTPVPFASPSVTQESESEAIAEPPHLTMSAEIWTATPVGEPTPPVTREGITENSPLSSTPALGAPVLKQPHPSPGTLSQERIPANNPARPDLTAEQLAAIEALRAVNVDYWMARKLARAHSPALIHQVLQHLRQRAGTVRNPAAWIVREIERGGYTPPSQAQEERLKNERAAREALQREREAQEREQAEQACEDLLARYRQLEPERQRALEQLTRTELTRLSPRLAGAPADVTTPGPFRSKLLELLELAPDIATQAASRATVAQLPVEPRRERLNPASGVLLERFRQLEPDRQRELEQRTRAELRRISPRLAEAAWELECPGPLRSQLLALLASLPADSS